MLAPGPSLGLLLPGASGDPNEGPHCYLQLGFSYSVFPGREFKKVFLSKWKNLINFLGFQYLALMQKIEILIPWWLETREAYRSFFSSSMPAFDDRMPREFLAKNRISPSTSLGPALPRNPAVSGAFRDTFKRECLDAQETW